jgi:hypothetical protein
VTARAIATAARTSTDGEDLTEPYFLGRFRAPTGADPFEATPTTANPAAPNRRASSSYRTT